MKESLRGVSLVALIAGGAALGIACGGDDDSTNPGPTSSSTSSSSGTSGASSSSGTSGSTTSSSSSSSTSSSSSSSSSGEIDAGPKQTVATPTFTTNPAIPGSGTFSGSVDVTVVTTTADATVFYTTDGTQPTRASQVATGPISVSKSGTTQIRAFAVKDGFDDSAVAFIDIKIQLTPGTIEAPTFNPTTTQRPNTFAVGLSTTPADATICVTTDGTSTPTCANGQCTGSSTQYNATNGGIQITQTNTTVKALACKAGSTDSEIKSQSYTLKVATPTSTPNAPVTFTTPTQVSLTTETIGGQIHFGFGAAIPTCGTANPGTPATPAQQTVTFNIAQTTTVNAIACKDGFITSEPVSFKYNVKSVSPTLTEDVAVPFPDPTNVHVSNGSGSALDCYTDGTAATVVAPECSADHLSCKTGTAYSGASMPLIVKDNQTVRIIRCEANLDPSDVVPFTYRLKASKIGVTYQLKTLGANTGLQVNDYLSNDPVLTGTADQVQFVAGPDAPTVGPNVTALDSTLTTAEKVCYTLDDTTPNCTQGGTAASPTLTCSPNSVDNSLAGQELAGQTKNLPIRVRAIACKVNYQNSDERSVFFASATDPTLTVDVTPTSNNGNQVNGAFDNDVKLAFVSKPTPASRICYTRAKAGATTFPAPTCNATKTDCGAGSTQYSDTVRPIVNGQTAASVGNRFKVIACAPGTNGQVNTQDEYVLRADAVDATTVAQGTVASGATLPNGTVVTFKSTTVDTAATGQTDPVTAASRVAICYTHGVAPVTDPGCVFGAAGTVPTCSGPGAVRQSATFVSATEQPYIANASEQVSVVTCKDGYTTNPVHFDFTTTGIAQPTFDLGVGTQAVYVRTGQNLVITSPSATNICVTTDGTDPTCTANQTTCSKGNAYNTINGGAGVPLTFDNTASPAQINVRAVTCSGSAQSTKTEATFSLAASPVLVTAYAANTAVYATLDANKNLTAGSPAPTAAGTTLTAGQDIYITQAGGAKKSTDNGSICYTLDGTDPSFTVVAQGSTTGATSFPEANIATPLNGAKTAPKLVADGTTPVVGGCVAKNLNTVCIRSSLSTGSTGTSGITVVGPDEDPRLANVGNNVKVRAQQCKNTAYATSAINAKDYSFTPYAHENFAFNGAPDSTAPAAFSTNENFTASAGTLHATWSASKVYLGITDAANLAAGSNTKFVQFYFRSGGTFTANGLTTTADNSAQAPVGSLIGWPANATGAQTLPTGVDYHLYLDTATVGGLGGGGGAQQTFKLRHWNGTVWTDVTGGESASIQVLSGVAGYLEIAIDRAAFSFPTLATGGAADQLFVAFGDLAASNAGTVYASYPDGATDALTGATGTPRQYTDKTDEPATDKAAGYLRLHLNGFQAPNYSGAGDVLSGNFKAKTVNIPNLVVSDVPTAP